ncbi:Structural maintenance of chromosomes protein 2 [Malassezia psittaci]|uniref:Structural maintenance of chromosomes protein n=1 Tax=Malassezia psittaci TaxID=1821823 RepID=A0AAF0JE62_9BASI|nr:Structural maintenance of chromosomes protein 2 [Malassezia psittaci]
MRIEELILDGFKSFNAITGLNGSGKSNILDAICFVLGLTNLSSVRASNIQDLIYKRGQAGIVKASVTIVFDNADRERSPVSFENSPTITVTRQIAMGGVSKYLINGHKATQQAVQNMFQSVQLNINNPNFLIMQGKITKVLNMKPAEILSMIEEAAGTRMFEERKERAVRTIAKKDQKVREITNLLQEEIKPKLDRLREEKRAFLEYQKASMELERATRLSKAFEWQNLRQKLAKESNEEADQLDAKLATYATEIEAYTRQLKAIDETLHNLHEKLDESLAGNDQQKELVQKAKLLSHSLVETITQSDFRRTASEEEARHVEEETKILADAEELLKKEQSSFDAMRDSVDSNKLAYDQAAQRVDEMEGLLQSLLTGIASAGETGKTGFQGQLAKAREREAAARSEIQQAKVRMEHLQRELRSKEPQAQKETGESAGLVAELDNAQHQAQSADQVVSNLNWDASYYEQVAEQHHQFESRMNSLRKDCDALQERLPSSLQFQYANPGNQIDTKKIHGLVARLVSLNERNQSYAPALEAAAGSRLYNVVVDNDKIGSRLLTHGQLKKRVTLIPLQQIQPNVVDRRRVEAAKRLAPNRVELALDLIECDPEVRPAMEYVFGQTLVCKDAETARRVTFDKNVQMKSVTIDGDTYDPAGRLAGGSKSSNGPSLLLRIQELAKCERALRQAEGNLRSHQREWDSLQTMHHEYAQAMEASELAHHRAELLQQQVNQSRAAALQAEVVACRNALVELADKMDQAAQREKEASQDVQRLQQEIKELHTDKEGKVERVRAETASLRAALNKQAAILKPQQSKLRQVELALGQFVMDRDAAKLRLEAAREASQQASNEFIQTETRAKSLQQEVDDCEAKLAKMRAAQHAYQEEVQQLEEAQSSKKQLLSDAQQAQQHLKSERERIEEECSILKHSLKKLEDEHPWILKESIEFGREGGEYDFASQDMTAVEQKCADLAEQQSGMRRRINPRVMNMIDSVEKKEASLQNMLTTVLGDKSKIEDTIHELDRYKQDALHSTFTQVNQAFGEIFAELLPGNYAKLQPPEGMELVQGLEVRVRLGATWKQSLTELSGGQRSLIALSLIMSLLQFKPAPMYILDEVDAALDLSHTQHIGQLFRTRFKGSQFIVVSLKEGLFNNASVVFRAKFRDGTSLVERIVQKSSDADKENFARSRLVSGRSTKAPSKTALLS